MGRIGTKLSRKYNRYKFSKLINFRETKLAKARLERVAPQLEEYLSRSKDDPNHKFYSAVQNQVSYFAEEASILKDFTAYYDAVVKGEDSYMPGYPPLSPLTNSYFIYWAFCDYQFGLDKETVTSIFHDIVAARHFDKTVLAALTNLSTSYMRFYKHLGIEGNFIVLQDIVTGDTFPSRSSSGSQGSKGQIWLTRLVPSLDGINDYHISLTTPYIIINYPEKEWLAFFERQGIHKDVAGYEQRYYEFMKHPQDYVYWHDYIMDGFFNYTSNYILLTGIPDIKGSKPHEMDD